MSNLLEVRDLKKYYHLGKGVGKEQANVVRAVDGINFAVKKCETLGLVGESGCGKSTAARVILRLLTATAGEILYEGQNIELLSHQQLLPYRRKMQIIFQDQAGSLNPQLTIGSALGEPLRIHRLVIGKKELKAKVEHLLELVGLCSEHMCRYPHELSGGQRQRIALARALALNPQLIVCDEPVSALDVSIQAQIINLLQDLQHKCGLTYIFIAHDLRVVNHISDRIAVMYLGKIVELAGKKALYSGAKHPYTQMLLSSIPRLAPAGQRQRTIFSGELPNPLHPPAGCHFHIRCPHAFVRCTIEEPLMQMIDSDHNVACHLLDK
ncbi:MAG: ATP-binding cassette domain-containing protein [Dethiobacter sp.]|jgi:oligopeptide transport system ATP-binding protein|nr:ATP-binding cassette domain-containing protein [Dethiobacter sp.]MBS3983311.1 ATP-binding cassette domain-containing protein [Dethiobacter sp.]MCL4462936.1 ATP-binding cassette domain-containing protein [Bacillota bacterium]